MNMTLGSFITFISFPLIIISGIFWWVSSQNTNSKIAAAACILSGVLGLAGYYLLSKDNVYKNFFDNHPKIYGGKVGHQIQYPTINLGGAKLTYTGSGNPFNFGWENNSFKMWLEDGKLKVNTSITNSNGKMVAMLNNNELTVNHNTAIDFNWDDRAVEVIDDYNRVVLQVELVGDSVNFAGIFALADGGAVAIGPATNGLSGGVIEIRPAGIPIKTSYKRMFNYPGSTHLHERVTAN